MRSTNIESRQDDDDFNAKRLYDQMLNLNDEPFMPRFFNLSELKRERLLRDYCERKPENKAEGFILLA